MRKIKVAVVGAGRLGGFHAQKLAARDDVELVAVVDPVEASRNRVAAECKTQALGDFRPVLAELDAAVIASPTRQHHAIAKELLSEGIHCLVEKPICTTVAEADELVDLAARRGAILQVGHVERFNPAFAAAADELGAPKYIEAVRTSPFTFRSTDVGAVLDMMIHDIDLVLSLAGSEVRRVEALGASVLGGHEDVANARIEFASGCVASLSTSRVSYETVRRMQAWSHTAFAAIDFGTRTADIVRPSQTLLERRFDVDALSPAEVEHYKKNLVAEHLPRQTRQFDAVDALALEAADFIDSVQHGRQPLVTGEAGRNALAVAAEILAAIRNHAWDDGREGLMGPMLEPRAKIIPAPHFNIGDAKRRQAG